MNQILDSHLVLNIVILLYTYQVLAEIVGQNSTYSPDQSRNLKTMTTINLQVRSKANLIEQNISQRSSKSLGMNLKTYQKLKSIHKISKSSSAEKLKKISKQNITSTNLIREPPTLLPKRPFYNIAHMCNSIKTAKKYLKRKTNALESDVTFRSNGSIVLFHDYPCDCLRLCTDTEKLSEFLEFIRNITTPGFENYNEELALLFLDLKTFDIPIDKKSESGHKLAELIVEHLFNEHPKGSKVKVLLSIEHISDYELILGFNNVLKNRNLSHINKLIGWDVGLDQDFPQNEQMWRKIETVGNLWEGEGLTNCLSPFLNTRLINVIKKREEQSVSDLNPYIQKVYHWTIDLTVYLRASLKVNVDAIITNYPERLTQLLKEEEFADKYRLATQSDNPWIRVKTPIDSDSSNEVFHHSINSLIVNDLPELFSSFRQFFKDFD